MAMFFAVWALLLIALLTVLIHKGYGHKARIKKVEKDVKGLSLKVNKLWEKTK